MIDAHNAKHGFSQQDRILFHTSPSWDLSVAQVFCALTSGATVALASQNIRKDPTGLARFIEQAEITVTYATPTQLAVLLEYGSESLKNNKRYRLCLVAGEVLPSRLVDAFYALQSPAILYNQYGPSEATVQTTSGTISPRMVSSSAVPIGYSLANCSHYIVDRNLRPVPPTVAGELCIGGAQVALGYANRPDADAAVFVKNPFASESFLQRGWDRLYRTGDKARFLHDGQLSFLGRLDGDCQVKLRGYRIDTAEIGNEVFRIWSDKKEHAIRETIVLARNLEQTQSFTDDRQLIAFIVLRDQMSDLSVQEVVNLTHDGLKARLNSYMLPSGYQLLDSLPLLPSGKVDRQWLLQMQLSLHHPGQDSYDSVRNSPNHETGLVEMVTELFRKSLKQPPGRVIAPNDSFFDLGGTSILLMRLRATVNRQFGAEIALTDMFQRPTPQGVAGLVSEHGSTTAPNPPRQLPATNIDWDAEIALSPDVVFPAASDRPAGKKTHILLTGVDSLHGIHLLAKIITKLPYSTVSVLGSATQQSFVDIWNALESRNLLSSLPGKQSLEEKINLVPGHLGLPHFGLQDSQFRQLGQSIDAILHTGGHVSLLQTYSDLKTLNTNSTRDVIDLARHGGSATKIHYLSTWSVLHLQLWSSSQRNAVSAEDREVSASFFRPGGDELGYLKTRWVSEQLLEEANRRGVPVTIYRSSAIAAPKAEPGTPESNFTQAMIKDMLRTGLVPDFSDAPKTFHIDFIPVEYMANIVATLFAGGSLLNHGKGAHYYHIGNPSPLPLTRLPDVVAELRSKNTQNLPKASLLDVNDWVAGMGSEQTDEVGQMQRAIFKRYLGLGHVMFSLDQTNTRNALIELGSADVLGTCPPIDADFLENMLQS